MDVIKKSSFILDGYPMATFMTENEEIVIFDGEGTKYHFDQNGKQLNIESISTIGFSDAVELERSALLRTLDGKLFYCDSQNPPGLIPSKSSSFCQWNNQVFFIQDHHLYSWNFEEESLKWDSFQEVEELLPCGDSLLVINQSAWVLLDSSGDVKTLTREPLPFSSCAYLPKNNTFHFVLPNGALGVMDLSQRDTDPYVTVGTGHSLRIVGTSGEDKVALSYLNQLVFMKATDIAPDAYVSLTVENLHSIPIKVLAHLHKAIFLVQEDQNTIAIWEADSSNCLWRGCFDNEICYMRLFENNFLLGFSNGEMINFVF